MYREYCAHIIEYVRSIYNRHNIMYANRDMLSAFRDANSWLFDQIFIPHYCCAAGGTQLLTGLRGASREWRERLPAPAHVAADELLVHAASKGFTELCKVAVRAGARDWIAATERAAGGGYEHICAQIRDHIARITAHVTVREFFARFPRMFRVMYDEDEYQVAEMRRQGIHPKRKIERFADSLVCDAILHGAVRAGNVRMCEIAREWRVAPRSPKLIKEAFRIGARAGHAETFELLLGWLPSDSIERGIEEILSGGMDGHHIDMWHAARSLMRSHARDDEPFIMPQFIMESAVHGRRMDLLELMDQWERDGDGEIVVDWASVITEALDYENLECLRFVLDRAKDPDYCELISAAMPFPALVRNTVFESFEKTRPSRRNRIEFYNTVLTYVTQTNTKILHYARKHGAQDFGSMLYRAGRHVHNARRAMRLMQIAFKWSREEYRVLMGQYLVDPTRDDLEFAGDMVHTPPVSWLHLERGILARSARLPVRGPRAMRKRIMTRIKKLRARICNFDIDN